MSRNAHGSGLPPQARLPPEPPTDPDTNLAEPQAVRPFSPERPEPRGELFVRSGPAAGLRFALDFALHRGVITIGRSSQSDCPLHDEAVSRRHFELEVAEDSIRLRDLGSGNGTRVNGRRVEETQLRPGDRIVAGNSTLEFLATALAPEAGDPPAGGTRRRSRWLGLAVGAPLLVVAALIALLVLHRRHTQQRVAEEAFDRGLAELAGDPPDPDLALADLSAAQRDLPDQRALRDAIAEAREIAGSIGRLAHARELSDQGSFSDARQQLQGLVAGPYFDRMALAISEEINRREAAKLSAQLSGPRPPLPVIRALVRPPGGAPVASAPPPPTKRPHRAAVTPADDDRAEQLCDDADALLGPNPEGARRKYRAALKISKPGSAAARRAQGGLEN